MVLAFCILSRDVLYLCKVSLKYHKRYSRYRAETVVCNVQRGITPKLYKPVMVLALCILFHDVLYLCKVS